MPAVDSASRSRRAVATDTSSSLASSAAVTRPRACMSKSAATRRSARMVPASRTKCSVVEHFSAENRNCHWQTEGRKNPMLRGLSTVSFFADDVVIRIGDYQHELGIIDSRFAPRGRPDKTAGAVIYWHVDDVRGAYDRLISMGATAYEEPVERGP